MVPKGFERLDANATRIFLDFVAAPAATLHPDWRAGLLPSWVEGSPLERNSAALSQGVLDALGLDQDMSSFSWQDPACVAALLPPVELLALARRLGLALHAPTLVRAIAKDQVALLDGLLSEEDWKTIRALGSLGWPRQPLPADAALATDESLREDGLLALLGVFGRLPQNIARRAQVKLPRREQTCSAGQLAQAGSVFPSVYQSFAPHGGEGWHALWDAPLNRTAH